MQGINSLAIISWIILLIPIFLIVYFPLRVVIKKSLGSLSWMPSGRINRKVYLLGELINFTLTILLPFLSVYFLLSNNLNVPIWLDFLLVFLGVILHEFFWWILAIKRMHDFGEQPSLSDLIFKWGLIPFYVYFKYYQLFSRPGDNWENNFGLKP